MRKILSLIISMIMLCGVNGIGTAYTSELPTYEETSTTNNTMENVQEDKIVEEKSDLSNEQVVEQKETTSSSETEKKKKNISTGSTTQKVEVEKKVEVIEEEPQVKENTNHIQPSSEVKEEQVIVPEKKVETPKNNPWDSLGITEYEFYNTPAHSWAKLDFKLSDYGSRDATYNACVKFGNENKSKYGGGFECLPVNNYNGDYIGEMIEFY